MKFGSLFSGIGGLDLGLERAGMTCEWQVEIDDYCRRVLAKHWPKVKRYEDIRNVNPSELSDVDLVCGGFPCQDISNAGKRAGIDGERSGLWSEFARIICGVRPRYVLVENVAALLGRGIERVLGDLAESGYDAEWESLPACAFGAPHVRERIFIVAYPASGRLQGGNPTIQHNSKKGLQRRSQFARSSSGINQTDVADTRSLNGEGSRCERDSSGEPTWAIGMRGAVLCNATGQGLPLRPALALGRSASQSEPQRSDWWAVEPNVGRVANGIPKRVDRLRGLGNAVVPQVAEWIGRRIIELSD